MVENIEKDSLHENEKLPCDNEEKQAKLKQMANRKDATFVEDKRSIFYMIYMMLHITLREEKEIKETKRKNLDR